MLKNTMARLEEYVEDCRRKGHRKGEWIAAETATDSDATGHRVQYDTRRRMAVAADTQALLGDMTDTRDREIFAITLAIL